MVSHGRLVFEAPSLGDKALCREFEQFMISGFHDLVRRFRDEFDREVIFDTAPASPFIPKFDHASASSDAQHIVTFDQSTFVTSCAIPVNETNRNKTRGSTSSDFAKMKENAFVINTRRWIEVSQILSLIHTIMDSLSIGALTMVVGNSWKGIIRSAVYLLWIITMTVLHDIDWDRFEVDDINMLLPLLVDDADPFRDGRNPNRFLKAISYIPYRWKLIIRHTIQFSYLCLAVFGWSVVVNHSEMAFSEDTFIKRLLDPCDEWIIEEDVDLVSLERQLMTGCLMAIVQAIFELIVWNETGAAMPLNANSEVWDARTDKLPLRYKLTGMPAMWFSCPAAREKLKMFVGEALGSPVYKIYPQEMASYALQGGSKAQNELTKALLKSSRYRKSTHEFHDNEQLGMSLYFFDSQVERYYCLSDTVVKGISRDLERAPWEPSNSE